MRYLAEGIHALDGVVDSSLLSQTYDLCVVKVADTDGGEPEFKRIVDINREEVLGIGRSHLYASDVFAIHTLKTASFHKYVEDAYVDFTFRMPERLSPVFSFWGIRGYVEPDKRCVYVETGKHVLDVTGLRGSVCIWKQNDELRVMTLWDFLSWFCEVVCPKTFEYERIMFCSQAYEMSTTICLAHTAEAEQFYVKAMMFK